MAKPYKEIFEIELDCWCHGLKSVKSEIDCNTLHQVVKQFSPTLHEAITNLYVFDIFDTTQKFITASHCKISEKELAFHILSLLPSPDSLSQAELSVLCEIVTCAEKKYSGAVSRLEKKWNKPFPQLAAQLPKTGPVFPPKNGSI